MSDAPAEKPEKPPAVPGSKPSKIVLILLALNLGASGFTTFKVVTAPEPAHAAPAEGEAKHAEPVGQEVTGPVVALDPFVVNLDEPGTSRYIKVTLQLELANPEAEHSIEKSKQLIRDMILSHLSGLKLADCLGATAKEKLRTDMVAKLTTILGPNKVRRMFFQEFVVQ
jgi:flagellar FliL protein